MFIRDFMTPNPITVRPETPVEDIANLLLAHRINGVPVIDADGRFACDSDKRERQDIRAREYLSCPGGGSHRYVSHMRKHAPDRLVWLTRPPPALHPHPTLPVLNRTANLKIKICIFFSLDFRAWLHLKIIRQLVSEVVFLFYSSI
jgi:CBS domain-containing protein